MSIYFIAEIGINHNGDMKIAKKLIDIAKEAKCDAVKFQKRNIDLVYSQEYLDSPRESPWGKTQRAQKKNLEFGLDEYREIDRYCKEKNIDWFASAWDLDSLAFLDQFDCKYAKIASAQICDNVFLESVAGRGKHTFISTGLSDIEMIGRAVNVFRKAKCDFTLLHCVGVYPMPDHLANLNCISTLRNTFNCPVGYSGHEAGLAISYAAATLGITCLERHITLNRAMYGSDQAASLEPGGLRQLMGAIRKIEIAMGDGKKRILPEEEAIVDKLRQMYKK